MRIIIRYCIPFLHQTTFVIEVEPNLTLTNLKEKILEKCKITQKNVFFKIEREDYLVIYKNIAKLIKILDIIDSIS